jgi:hypothetical protein
VPKTVEAPGVTVSTYLAPAEAALLRARAGRSERSIAAELRLALRDYLKNDEDPAVTPGLVEGSGRPSGHGET